MLPTKHRVLTAKAQPLLDRAELWEDKDCQGRKRWATRQPYNGHQNALALKTSLHTIAIVTVTFASAQRDYGHCVQSCHEASHCYPRTAQLTKTALRPYDGHW